jgi:hypothetical protein
MTDLPDWLLQLWGGVFFLLNKVFLAFAEHSVRRRRKRFWRIWGWSVYIIGLPPWIVIFISRSWWILTFVESASLPSMVLGLVIALQVKRRRAPQWLNHLAVIAAVAGIYVSCRNLGIMTKLSQWLELGTVVGVLVGTYLLAHKRPIGYIWFIIMIGCNMPLLYMDGYRWLVVQQIVSIGFVIDAFVMTILRRRARSQSRQRWKPALQRQHLEPHLAV